MAQNIPRVLLSLDGGGIRGLSPIIILKEIMKAINRGREEKVQPWQVFDLIGGTSTGGIIAVMLGRLKMTLDQCESAYRQLSQAIFEPNYRSFDPRRAFEKLKAEGKYDAVALELAVKEIVKKYGCEEAPLMEDADVACKVFVCAVSKDNGRFVPLRSYDNPSDFGDQLSENFKIWEACRATSAATTFFDPFILPELGVGFVDGGLLYNNPVDKVMSEAKKLWPNEPVIMMSIGTGNAPGQPIEGNILKIAERMAEIVTKTDEDAVAFYEANPAMVENNLYYRFNVPGMANIGLEEYKFLPRVTAETLHYLRDGETGTKMKRCLGMLVGRQGQHRHFQDFDSIYHLTMVRTVAEDDTGLRVLWEPSGDDSTASSGASIIDIVAVHGIGAHPDDTWCKKGKDEQYVNWLEDERMLPSIAPQARIMRYGYESQWFGGGSIVRLRTSTIAAQLLADLKSERAKCPSRPMILIAHCFGGLVVLKALRQALDNEQECPGLFRSTTGLVFFGTPFRGTEGMKQSDMLQAALSQYPQNVRIESLHILAPGDDLLQEVVDKFLETRSKSYPAHVACFYETKSSNVGAIVGEKDRYEVVVNESSGCLDHTGSVEKYPLSRTHFDINKFGSPSEPSYRRVCSVIKDMITAAPDILAARSQSEGAIVQSLHDACRKDHVAKVRSLISLERVSVDARSDQGLTPLMTAIRYGSTGSFHLLIDFDADIEAPMDIEHRTLVQPQLDFEDSIQEGCRPLFLAALNSRELMTEILLKKGASKEATTNQGITPLHAAAIKTNTEVVRILLRYGCDIEAETEGNFTPLIYAANRSRTSIARVLLSKGADIEARKSFGMTALHEAIWVRDESMVRLLLECGANCESQADSMPNTSFHGMTALHFAAALGYVDLVTMLLRSGAHVEQESGEGLTALTIARNMSHEHVVTIIENWKRVRMDCSLYTP